MTPEGFKLVQFSRALYPIYKSWFESPSIANAIGHIDQDWLSFILKDTSGTELALLDTSNQLLGVVGLVLPTSENNYYVVSNIAVNPELQQQGLGSIILGLLYDKYQLSHQQSWITFIAHNNKAAQAFFERNRWIKMGQDEEFLRYKWGKLG